MKYSKWGYYVAIAIMAVLTIILFFGALSKGSEELSESKANKDEASEEPTTEAPAKKEPKEKTNDNNDADTDNDPSAELPTAEVPSVETGETTQSTESVVEPNTEGATVDTSATTYQPQVNEPKSSETSAKAMGASMNVDATYYLANCPEGCTGITATGIDVRNNWKPNGQRIVAVDPNVIPLGSKVRVDTPYESFTAIAGDTGGGIKGNKLDILAPNLSYAQSMGGRVNAKVTVVN